MVVGSTRVHLVLSSRHAFDTFFPAEILFFRGTCHPNARHDNEQRESKSVFSHFFLLPCRHATYDRWFSQSTDVRFLDEVGGQLTAHVTGKTITATIAESTSAEAGDRRNPP